MMRHRTSSLVTAARVDNSFENLHRGVRDWLGWIGGPVALPDRFGRIVLAPDGDWHSTHAGRGRTFARGS